MRVWTDAAKAAQREAIKRWQPWTKSTGPRTETGKERSSTNARKTGRPSIKSLRVLRVALRVQSQFCKTVNQYLSWQQAKKSENQTIMMAQLRSLAETLHVTFLKKILEWQTLDREEGTWPPQIMPLDMPLDMSLDMSFDMSCEMKMAA